MTHARLKIAVSVSGGGRSLENLLSKQNQSAYTVTAVLASRADCGAVEVARRHNIPLWIGSFPREMPIDEQNRLENWLKLHKVDFIVLAGFLRPFPILSSYEKNIINIHPSLLPSYGGQGMYGSRVHEAVWNAKEKYSGATVHFVSNEYDKGTVIAQVRVNVNGLESPEAIASRVFSAESRLYPSVIDKIARGLLPTTDKNHPIFEEDEI